MKSRPNKINKIISTSKHLKNLLYVSRQQEQILKTIKQLLDTQLAAHCISAHYSKQRLKIFTDSSVWASRLRFQTKSLAGKLATHQLSVHKIDVRVIPKSKTFQPATNKKIRSANKISAQAAENIVQTAGLVNDEDLETALRRLARSVTRTQKS